MYPLNYFLFLQIILFLFITPGTPRNCNYFIFNELWCSKMCLDSSWRCYGKYHSSNFSNFCNRDLFFQKTLLYLMHLNGLGVVYILYLAYDLYNSRPKDINSNNISSKSFFSFFKDGFLVAGTSPKAWMFFPLIFPQFIDFNSNYFSPIHNFNYNLCCFRFFIFDCLCLTCSKIN
jgi:threonine/homoserine/homoserine lactone efflux protein